MTGSERFVGGRVLRSRERRKEGAMPDTRTDEQKKHDEVADSLGEARRELERAAREHRDRRTAETSDRLDAAAIRFGDAEAAYEEAGGR